jgi:ABC-type multidrug transport system fused ATPase/permease subunit
MRAYKTDLKNRVIIESKWYLLGIFVSMMTVAILIINAYSSFTASGVIVIGTLFILYRYLESIAGTFYTFAWLYGEIIEQDAAVKAVEEITREEPDYIDKKHRLPNNWKMIQICNLNFRYSGQESNGSGGNLKSVTIKIPRAFKIAFIGESGSGKSTMFSLLRGLHEADEVVAYCDGKKLSYGLKHLYEHITLIPQEPELFNNTIEYNIAMGTDVIDKKIVKAAEIARFDKVVGRLPKGYGSSVLEKGVSLSGGERQRLAVARGILAAERSDILLLDEPTSSVDDMNEQKIYENIFANYQKKTIISAVHRLHLLPRFDYVYMFAHGRIIAQGSFRELLIDNKFKILWEQYMAEKEQKK